MYQYPRKEESDIQPYEVPGRSPKAMTPTMGGSPPFASFPFAFRNTSLERAHMLDLSQSAPSVTNPAHSPPDSLAPSSFAQVETSPFLFAVHKEFVEAESVRNFSLPPGSPQTPTSPKTDAFGVTEYDLEQNSSWRDSLVLLKLFSLLCIVLVAVVAFAIPIFLVIYNTAGRIKGRTDGL
eukprot:jgi/Mesvir1/871/Mv17440-RA.1